MALYSEGGEVWIHLLDIYGRVKYGFKSSSSFGDEVFPFVPFLYQGQYYDFETGAYISQDPIGLAGGNLILVWIYEG